MQDTRQLIKAVAFTCVLAVLSLAATCGTPSLPSALMAGKDEGGVLYAGPLVPDYTADVKLHRVDVTDRSRTVAAEAVGFDAISDGQYVAWADYDASVVRVLELATGQTKEYLGDVGAEGLYGVRLWDVNAGRLLATYPNQANLSTLSPLVLIDLATGGRRSLDWSKDPDSRLDLLGGADLLYGTILEGDYVALFANPLDKSEELALEYSARLEVIDLNTGEHTVVDRAMRTNASLFAAAGKVVWSQFKPGGFHSRVRSYDLAKGTLSTVIEDFDTRDETAYVVDFDGEHLLAVRQAEIATGGAFWLSWPVGDRLLEILSIDGGTETVASSRMPCSMSIPSEGFDQARLVSHFVVWPDEQAGELVLYDVDTKFTNRRPLFED